MGRVVDMACLQVGKSEKLIRDSENAFQNAKKLTMCCSKEKCVWRFYISLICTGMKSCG